MAEPAAIIGLNSKVEVLAQTVDFFADLICGLNLSIMSLLGEVQLELLLLASRCQLLGTSIFAFATLLS